MENRIADQVNAEVQRQIGQMVIEQIAAQIQAQAMQARIAELEAAQKDGLTGTGQGGNLDTAD